MLKRKLMMLHLMLISGGYKRAEYLQKKKYFHRQGVHCFLTPYNYGTEPYMISLGDNVHVATGVRFITHDVAAKMFSYMDQERTYTSRIGPITIGDNVFIGAGATILYDVEIGNNVVIAAGAVVSSNVPSGCVYGGIPARKIGEFSEYMKKCGGYSEKLPWKDQDTVSSRKAKQIEYFFQA